METKETVYAPGISAACSDCQARFGITNLYDDDTDTEETNEAMKAMKPESKLTKHQTREETRYYTENGCEYRTTMKLRYDDECGNGHNTFAITGNIDLKIPGGRWYNDAGGCIHEEIAKHFPEYARFIKWHLVSSDGPMHYIPNTVYHAGDKDCRGLRKGEFRQHTSRGKQNDGIEGIPNWTLKIPEGTPTDVYANEKPEPVTLEWEPFGRTGEGKERKLDAARRSAVWEDATDEELTAPGLEERLTARLPALMEDFKRDMEELGFVF